MTSVPFPTPGDGARPFADALASAGRSLDEAAVILRHLLGQADRALFADRIVAQVRAQVAHVAAQLAAAAELPGEQAAVLAAALLAQPQLVAHAQALALEAELAERLAERLALDPVLPPLLQAESAGNDAAGSAALALVGAQARFVQAQRRGELPLEELPAELFDAALTALRTAWTEETARVGHVEALVRERCAGPDRRALLEPLAGHAAALELERAGVAVFVSALAHGAGIDRDEAVLATTRGQVPRLVAALAAAGASRAAIERQLVVLHPDAELPADLPDPAQAAALLARGEGLLG